jgi:DNA-binding transcriptional LysR family regulator
MHKTLRRLPSLDFLRGFEASGRLKSFTRAADELHLTQSALSRQVAAIEEALGVALFERKHRALSFTPEGEAFHREITTHLQAIARAAESVGNARRSPGLTVTTTVSFASLWLIPRLARFRAKQPDVEVYVSADDRTVDLARGEVDVAIRYVGQDSRLPAGGLVMFGERMLPVVAPSVANDPRTPLKQPGDLAKHVLLHLDDPEGRTPVARLGGVAHRERRSRPQARGVAALHALRPGDPGRRRRAGRRARPAAADRRIPARRAASSRRSRSATTPSAATSRWSRRTRRRART